MLQEAMRDHNQTNASREQERIDFANAVLRNSIDGRVYPSRMKRNPYLCMVDLFPERMLESWLKEHPTLYQVEHVDANLWYFKRADMTPAPAQMGGQIATPMPPIGGSGASANASSSSTTWSNTSAHSPSTWLGDGPTGQLGETFGQAVATGMQEPANYYSSSPHLVPKGPQGHTQDRTEFQEPAPAHCTSLVTPTRIGATNSGMPPTNGISQEQHTMSLIEATNPDQVPLPWPAWEDIINEELNMGFTNGGGTPQPPVGPGPTPTGHGQPMVPPIGGNMPPMIGEDGHPMHHDLRGTSYEDLLLGPGDGGWPKPVPGDYPMQGDTPPSPEGPGRASLGTPPPGVVSDSPAAPMGQTQPSANPCSQVSATPLDMVVATGVAKFQHIRMAKLVSHDEGCCWEATSSNEPNIGVKELFHDRPTRCDGRNPEVQNRILQQHPTNFQYLCRIVRERLETCTSEHISISIYCRSGKHRSVAAVELIGTILRTLSIDVRVFHKSLQWHRRRKCPCHICNKFGSTGEPTTSAELLRLFLEA